MSRAKLTKRERLKRERAALLLCCAAAEHAPLVVPFGLDHGFSPAVCRFALARWDLEFRAACTHGMDQVRLTTAEQLYAELYS